MTAPAVIAPAGVDAPRRISSIDIVRGVVMVLMALDHVRVYSGIPAGGPTAGVFFTRWVTHFCAPAFVFLAGTAVFLHGQKVREPGPLARYLLTRGALLVVLELTVIRWFWRFSFSDPTFLAGVIWMLGWCMILLAPLVRCSPRSLAVVGVGIIALQQVFGVIPAALPEGVRAATGWLWAFTYLGGEVPVGQSGVSFNVLYSLVPWIGVMAAGYGFGPLMRRSPDERRRLCLRIGLSATALFVVGALAAYLLGSRRDGMPVVFQLLEQQKYPASQLFLLMTLGPTIALLPFAEKARGIVASALETIGRVPMFYYLLHIPLIHLLALIVWQLRDGTMGNDRFATAPYVWMPEPDRWSLPLLYLVFAVAVALLYPACRWFARLKARDGRPWLRYL